MTGQRPSLGRIVLVPAPPVMNNGGMLAPAVITGVNSDTSVNVRVLYDSHQEPDWRTSVALVDEIPDWNPTENNMPHVAIWPPRV